MALEFRVRSLIGDNAHQRAFLCPGTGRRGSVSTGQVIVLRYRYGSLFWRSLLQYRPLYWLELGERLDEVAYPVHSDRHQALTELISVLIDEEDARDFLLQLARNRRKRVADRIIVGLAQRYCDSLKARVQGVLYSDIARLVAIDHSDVCRLNIICDTHQNIVGQAYI